MHKTLIVFSYYAERSTEVHIADLTSSELAIAKRANGLLIGETDYSEEDVEALDWLNCFISEDERIKCVHSATHGGDISLDGVEAITIVGAVR